MSQTNTKETPRNAAAASTKLPLSIYILALGTFLMLTTEFIIAGMLPEIAADLEISLAAAGSLITVFAAGMVVGAPLMAILTIKLPNKLTLILALLVFSAGHVAVALSTSLPLLLGARFITALATGAFWSIASVVAARLAPAGSSSRALGMITAGGMLATVLGVPIGAFFAQITGWRGTFVALGIMALIVAGVIGKCIPDQNNDLSQFSLRSELAGLRSPRLWLVLAACATTTGGVLAAYSYIAPMLTQSAGFSPSAVPWILAVFGVGSFIGAILGGRIGDRRPHLLTILVPIASALLLGLIYLSSSNPFLLLILIGLLGLSGLSVNPVLISLALRYSQQAPALGSSLSVAAFNLGTMAASFFGGKMLESDFGAQGPVLLGMAVVALTLIPAIILATPETTATTAS
ncbi:MFS transporter [Glutamicibacter sp.]|uniref:MFS transporter n=1 Tax=Glutamicibacter sp. TaxID=1931995 RepID=UPI0028BF2B60|nr:MFS transporter [Glutamicibacter sp.]